MKIGTATVACDYEVWIGAQNPDPNDPDQEVPKWVPSGQQTSWGLDIQVFADSIIETEHREFVPPMVGSGLSTSVLYLVSNCGTQSYRNSPDEGEMLFPIQVSGIIQNAYSPSFPLQAGSDIIGKIPSSSLSNLSFQLVDANFHPIKLLSPLYLTLSVNAAEDPSEDLTPFVGKLPKDRPTPEQAQQMAQQQLGCRRPSSGRSSGSDTNF
jgi:hypothetical protein